MPLQNWCGFFITALVLGLVPGPDNLFVLTTSATRGTRPALAVVGGLCTGLLGHTLAVMLGVASLFAASPRAFVALKIVGAVYLLYLAFRAWTAGPLHTGAQVASSRLWTDYARGVAMNLTNPKVTLFFLALLPQYVTDPAHAPHQLLLLGLTFIAATAIVFGVIAASGSRARTWLLASALRARWLNRISSIVFVGLAVRLAFARH